MKIHCVPDDPEFRILTEVDTPGQSTQAQLKEEVRKYLRLLPEIAEPNLAQVREIQEQIKQGTYLTREIVEETAGRLALRFLRKE